MSLEDRLEEIGTILRDFDNLINYIGTSGIPVSGKHHLFTMKSLPELNELLTHPLETGLQRPQLKSYPHLSGLYLLLRTSGLGVLGQKGKSDVLAVDAAMWENWKRLTTTERYFSLLRALWCNGSLEILGERQNYTNEFLPKCLQFFANIPDAGHVLSRNPVLESILGYSPGWYFLALMELLGFIEIEHGAPCPGQGWQILSIRATRWGRAVVGSIRDFFQEKDDNAFPVSMFFIQEAQDEFTRWEAYVRPCFKMWNQLLIVPTPEVNNGIHIFKVSLGKVWRRIAISGESSLEELACAVLEAVGFCNDHLYQFIYKDRFGVTQYANHAYMEGSDAPFVHNVSIGDLSLLPGTKLQFRFDFGDEWTFQLLVENVDAKDIDIAKPTVIATYGEAPEQYPEYE